MIFSNFPKISLGFYNGNPTAFTIGFQGGSGNINVKKISSLKIIFSIENQKSLRNVCLSSYKVTLYKFLSQLKKFGYHIFHWLEVCNFFVKKSPFYKGNQWNPIVNCRSCFKKVANFLPCQSMENIVFKLLQSRWNFKQSNFIGW